MFYSTDAIFMYTNLKLKKIITPFLYKSFQYSIKIIVLYTFQFVRGNKFNTYAIVYVLQIIIALIIYISIILSNLGLMMIFYELNIQYEILLNGLDNAFTYRKKNKFEILFNNCIRHHQIIIE